MSDSPQPVDIQLHTKSRILSITFSDSATFRLPFEYLRVFSRAAEVKTSSTPIHGKESVNIESIEPQGSYAAKIIFDDGHDTGIYSWETLYELGTNLETNWAHYLEQLQEHGLSHASQSSETQSGTINVKLLYFAWLANKLRKETETLELPAGTDTVSKLLTVLQRRYRDRSHFFSVENLRVTVNRQFAEEFTKIENNDEIALVPVTPTPIS